ncbi:MAG: hypothetical protein JWQ39_1289 [Glaciihabitans sp.]|jgi:hypothetical protein|nr:hypothetical protein [Glaciihabitans sp.]
MSNQTQSRKAPRIVAELGRPETPAETAARKAENSRLHRANQTTRNLVLALIASLAVVLFVVLVVIRPNNNLYGYVDYKAIATGAQSGISTPLVAPQLPTGWKANKAELKTGGSGDQTWSVGLITPKQQFIGIEEGVKTSNTWLGALLGKAQPTGHITIDRIHWTIYDQRATSGNFQYSLAGTAGTTDYVLHGSAGDGEFHELAAAIAQFLTNAGQKVS